MRLPLSLGIALGFAPYIAFFIGMRLASAEAGLWAALVVAIVNAGRDRVAGGSTKLLEIGAILLFAALAGFTAVTHWAWTVMSVRLAVDIGLLAIMLVSLAVGQPFTVQYARERVAEEVWRTPLFAQVNRRITLAWALAFAILVAAHAAVVFDPSVPIWADIAVSIVALAAAVRFSTWYPGFARRKAGAASRSG
ncbi:MAG: hypothetical protein ACHQAY_20405 [Hyphomicrobiales bacterium]